MPLYEGQSKGALKKNFKKLKEEGYPEKQRIAIVLSKAGLSNKSKKKKE